MSNYTPKIQILATAMNLLQTLSLTLSGLGTQLGSADQGKLTHALWWNMMFIFNNSYTPWHPILLS